MYMSAGFSGLRLRKAIKRESHNKKTDHTGYQRIGREYESKKFKIKGF